MRRLSVTIGIILFTLVVFVSLLVYGWTHRYGPASGTEPSQFPKLRVPHLAQSLELEQDLWAEPWSEVPKVEIPLVHQITEKPWPKGHTTAARVRAFHN